MANRTPPFCPNRECEAHYDRPTHRFWVCRGTYSSQLHTRIQRFTCRLCGCGFSGQTFSIDYYAKQSVDYRKLVGLVASCCGVRQMARYLGVGYETVLWVDEVILLKRPFRLVPGGFELQADL